MSSSGRLYAFGSNGSGQLGLDHRNDVSAPRRCIFPQMPAFDVPVKFAAGGNHTLVLFQSGRIYATGENRDGRSCNPYSPGFRQVDFRSGTGALIDRFAFCSATWEASIFVERDHHHVYTCGTGNRGELGQGQETMVSPVPRQIENFPPPGTTIVDLASGMCHTVAVLSSGEVYGWGHNRKGVLGDPPEPVWAPRRIEGIPFHAVRACCGREFTYIVGNVDTGEHVVLGSDKWQVMTSAPKNVRGWKDISASWGGIYVVSRHDTLWSWGRDSHGQMPPPDLLPISLLATGSEHILALDRDQRLVAWGWGEHGNCGPNVDSTGVVKGRWNLISNDAESSATESIVAIGAGCATSWIWYGMKHS